MDDVIITSPSFKDHLDHLNQVFTLLRDAGLTLNKEKCHFAPDKLKYLGLIISKDGIETDSNKVRAITEMRPPKNNREVSKCLGMTGCSTSAMRNERNVSSAVWLQKTVTLKETMLNFTAKRNRRSTASDLSRQLSPATGTTVSRQAVYRRLGHIGLYARRPVRCVPLTATHCRLRLTWSRKHALWTPQQWSCVMFSDESRFSLHSDSRRTLIWRAPGTRFHQEETIDRHR
ncbi:transposable element Tcb1 transposase [Trichonephila clavipes]|nr:transposable element Tcb1 transposase [Trichonephila clavipes]